MGVLAKSIWGYVVVRVFTIHVQEYEYECERCSINSEIQFQCVYFIYVINPIVLLKAAPSMVGGNMAARQQIQ